MSGPYNAGVPLEFAVDGLRGFATVGLLAAFGALGWSLALRWLAAEARPAVRLSAALLIAFFAATAAFWLTAPLGLFRLTLVGPGVCAVAAWSCRRVRSASPATRLVSDLRAARSRFRSLLPRPAGWLLVLALVWAGVAFFRGSLAPPLGWDGLTYHLVKAGRFVQTGGLVPEPAPDAWEYYEFFPLGGTLLRAWALALFPNALLLAGLGLLEWATALLAIYSAARELEATPEAAATAAVAVAGMPAALGWIASGYVDNWTLASFALGTVFLIRATAGFPREAPLAAAALGLMAGVRVTNLPILALGLLVLAATLGRGRRWLIVPCLLVALVGAPSYLRAWIEKGSPFYPVAVAGLPGSPIFEGTTTVRPVSGWRRGTPHGRPDASLLYARDPVHGWFLNPGPGLALLPLAAVAGLQSLADRRRRGALLFLVGASLVVLGSLWSAAMEIYRVGTWSHTAGRFLLPGIAGLALLGALAERGASGRVAQKLMLCAAFAGLLWAWPLGWSHAELGGLVALVAIAATAVLGFRGLRGVRGGHGGPPLRHAQGLGTSWRAAALAALAVALALAGASAVRRAWRYELYAAAAHPAHPLFHSHPLGPDFVPAWPLWRDLDDGTPRRIATTAGWDGIGHNHYRFPFFGSELQNRVLAIPITRDGQVLNAVDELPNDPRVSFDAWLARLVAERIDVVVSLPPRTSAEDAWMLAHPDLFEVWSCSERKEAMAFRFHRERVGGG